ncbi:MAG: TRAP transporter small permease [Deltaproteobacteria bacterium]|jgi:TRAP-type C4-dicarboxylate transport system permease small subunit|nr:TRAP transporter small permease [Deltaproteobacteria bacterium]
MITQFIRGVALLSRVAGVVAGSMIVVSVLVVCQMVFIRYILRGSVIWQTEFVTYLLIAATLVGSPYVLLTKGHVNVELLPRYLGPRARFVVALLAAVIALVFCIITAWAGYEEWNDAWSNNWYSDTIWAVRLWIPYLAMPVGFGLLALQYVADLACLVTGREPPFGIRKEPAE